MLRVVSAVVLALALTMGGVVGVADAAGPGDLLFGVDRAVEELRLRLTTDEVAEARLHLEFAGERLAEAELELATEGNLQNVEEALAAFNSALADLQPLLDQLTPEQRTMVQEALASLRSSREGIMELSIEIVDGEVELELEEEVDCEDEEAGVAEPEDEDDGEDEDAGAEDEDEGGDEAAEGEDPNDGEDEDAEADDEDTGAAEDAADEDELEDEDDEPEC